MGVTTGDDGGLVHWVSARGVQRHQSVAALVVCCQPAALLVDDGTLIHRTHYIHQRQYTSISSNVQDLKLTNIITYDLMSAFRVS